MSATLHVPVGGKLLTALSDARTCSWHLRAGVAAPAASAGCQDLSKAVVQILPTERSHISKREAREGERLVLPGDRQAGHEDPSCPTRSLASSKWTLQGALESTTLPRSSKSPVLELPKPARTLDFRAGGYIQIECPPHRYRASRTIRRTRMNFAATGIASICGISTSTIGGEQRLSCARTPWRTIPEEREYHHAERAHRHAAAGR